MAGRALSAISALCLLLIGSAPAHAVQSRRAGAAGAVQTVATGLHTTTAFAFGDGRVFAAEQFGDELAPQGGVYVLGGGRARQIYSHAAFGLAWHRGALYVSAVQDLVRLSGWNGRSFAHAQTLYRGSSGFTGFNGIAFGANGRLYAGVYLGDNDHNPTSTPNAFEVLSFNDRGTDLRVVARGLRQPWQLAFPAGSSAPYISILGQDEPQGVNAPDLIVRVRPGENYGFPGCDWVASSPCGGFARPVRFLAPHTDPGGLAIVGHTLYATEFGFGFVAPHLPRVIAIPLGRPGAVRTVASGFNQAAVGLGANGGWLYIGGASGTVFRLHL